MEKKASQVEKRVQKNFYMGRQYAQAFDRLALREKHETGKLAPQLIEEALLLLFKKYKEEMSKE